MVQFSLNIASVQPTSNHHKYNIIIIFQNLSKYLLPNKNIYKTKESSCNNIEMKCFSELNLSKPLSFDIMVVCWAFSD